MALVNIANIDTYACCYASTRSIVYELFFNEIGMKLIETFTAVMCYTFLLFALQGCGCGFEGQTLLFSAERHSTV